ncbi:MAG: hypothetical protein HOV81_29155 [Kofleriaceae bacterium]|nr:hypothetical protein [Kofleriaceae bacterium]
MKLHIPSFMIGVGVGASGAAVAPRLKPVFLEIATRAYKLGDLVMVRIARTREDLSDLLAEAKARARNRLAPRTEAA